MQHLESLRHQIHDAEDLATKISVQEHTQITIIHALEKDLCSAKSVTLQIVDDADQMLKKTVDVHSQIFDKGRLISALESDYVSLAETLDLIQQERFSVSAKILEKRLYYSKLREEMSSEFIQNQTVNATDAGTRKPEERSSREDHSNNSKEVSKQPWRELNSVKSKFEKITNAKHNLLSENNKIQQAIEQVKCQENDMKLQLESKGIDMMSLEDECKALSSDKNGEQEYLQSLQLQIERLKGISQVTRCDCGQEYKLDGKPTCP